MITIKTIQELVGLNISDGNTHRMIQRVTEDKNKIGEHFYSFHCPAILNGERENKALEIRLMRGERYTKTNSGYELFVMGLQARTHKYLTLDDLRYKGILLQRIDEVVKQSRDWWVNVANNNYK